MATTDTLMVMDDELQAQITQVRARVNTIDVNLRLFTEDEDPTPDKQDRTDYSEPVFEDYAAVSLTGEWTTPARDQAGVWVMTTDVYEFEIEAGEGGEDDDETIHGIFIEKDDRVICAGRLPVPVNLLVGGDPLRVRVVYVQYAALVYAQIVLA